MGHFRYIANGKENGRNISKIEDAEDVKREGFNEGCKELEWSMYVRKEGVPWGAETEKVRRK